MSGHQTIVHGGRYEVIRQLGRGGFKTVWLAQDHFIDEPIALAVLNPSSEEEALRPAFFREAKILRSLTMNLPPEVAPFKRRVVECLDFGELSETPPFQGLYLSTRFIEGQPLNTLSRQGALPMTWDRAVLIAIGVLEALELSHTKTAHRHPVVHRDLKPANIMLGPEDAVTVIDFGIAKLIETTGAEQSQVTGSFRYMAPEQFQSGRPIGPWTDIFGVGAVLHELLTAHAPRPKSKMADILAQISSGQPTPVAFDVLQTASLPESLVHCVRRALANAPEDRPASALLMKQELQALLKDHQTKVFVPAPLPLREDTLLRPASTRSLPPKAPSAPRSRIWMIAASTGAVLLGWWLQPWLTDPAHEPNPESLSTVIVPPSPVSASDPRPANPQPVVVARPRHPAPPPSDRAPPSKRKSRPKKTRASNPKSPQKPTSESSHAEVLRRIQTLRAAVSSAPAAELPSLFDRVRRVIRDAPVDGPTKNRLENARHLSFQTGDRAGLLKILRTLERATQNK